MDDRWPSRKTAACFPSPGVRHAPPAVRKDLGVGKIFSLTVGAENLSSVG